MTLPLFFIVLMATFLTFFHPTFYPVFLPPLFQVFPEAESVVVAELSLEVVSVAAELSPEVVSQSVLVVVSQSVLVVESVFDVAEPQASVDIAVVFVVLVPVSVAVVEVDSSGRPKFLVFPNVGFFASYSSSVELVGEVFVDNPTDVRTNYGLCSILSNLGLHQNKNLEWCCNNPSPCYNNVSDTNALPKNATKSHSRKRSLHQCQGQRKHTSQVSLLTLVVRQIRWVVVEEN